jgi:nitroreductase
MNDTITEKIKAAFAWRAAVKAYDTSKKVSDADIATIQDAARMSPGAYGLQPYHIIDVRDPALRAKVREAAYGQAQTTDASHLFVIAVRTDIDAAFIDEFVRNTATTRGLDIATLAGFRDMMVNDITTRTSEGRFAWAGRQAYIGFGAMIETAALLGVDAGPMEGFNPAAVNEALGLDALKLNAVGLFVLGYRSDEDKWSTMPKVRIAKEDFVILK